MSISGRAILAGVIGYPVAHSLSPRLHSYWLREYAIDGAYIPLPVARESFATVIASLRAADFAGVNVTVPHKEAAFALAERHDRAALMSGAVNLLVFRGGHIEGCNSDVAGLVASLGENLGHEALRGAAVAVLGAGGAARAALLALDAMGAAEIRILARNVARAESLVRDLPTATAAILRPFAWSAWPIAASGTALLLNATSAGLRGKSALSLSLDDLPPDAAVCDIVYDPLETELLKTARARGHTVIDGLGMLMHQAVPAFAAFYGVTPKVTPALRLELEKALVHGG
ncbi:MAG: shikimate dehydrogenase [Rhizomicrobium sp.]